MRKYNLKWSETDVKFVEALLLATGGEGSATLQDTLLMGDALDCNVFTLPELEQTLEKLIAADCLQLLKNKLALNASFLKDFETAVTAIPDISDAERIEELLKCHELSESKLDEVREQLKKYKLKTHYQQYHEQFG